MSHNKHPCSYTGYTFMLDFSSYTSLFFGFSSQVSQVMENPPCVDVLPSWELAYPLAAGTFESMIFLFPRWDL